MRVFVIFIETMKLIFNIFGMKKNIKTYLEWKKYIRNEKD
jgi:hypothetical protein